MLKLIACDIDGTLLPYGVEAIPPELPDLIHRLRKAGVLFCPASGRQYHSVRRLFPPETASELYFICENGAVVFGPGPEETPPVLSKTPLPREDALALIREILALPGYDAFVSGPFEGYICGSNPALIQELITLGIRFRQAGQPKDIPEDLLEISVFCPNGPDRAVEALGAWRERFNMAVSGPKWLDFNVSDKGVGLRRLCENLGVDFTDAAVFGDNWNDVPMLEIAGHPWLMETAGPAIRARFPRQCSSVTTVLREILAELEGA